MSFVSSYKNDIYLSFSELDNLPQESDDTGWVTDFISALRRVLVMKLGEIGNLSLCLNGKTEGKDGANSSAEGSLEQSSIFLIILSPEYAETEPCLKEIRTYLQILKDRGNGGLEQIFVVEKEKLTAENRPRELSCLFNYRFWDEGRLGKQQTLTFPKPGSKDTKYYYKIEDLASDIGKELQRLKKNGTSEKKGNLNSIPPATVFLAEVSDDLQDQRKAVQGYLEQLDIRVLPETSIRAISVLDAKKILNKNLKNSDVFVQLLSDQIESISTKEDNNFVRLQYDLAIENDSKILQWRSPELDLSGITEGIRKTFLQLNTVMAISIEDFKREIVQQSIEEPRILPGRKELIFLNTSLEDLALAKKIAFSLKKFGLGCILPKGEGSPRAIRQDLEDNLRSCDILLIVYGKITPVWVREQLNYALKVHRERPFDTIGIYEGSATNKALDLNLPEIKIINGRQSYNEPEIQRFISPFQS